MYRCCNAVSTSPKVPEHALACAKHWGRDSWVGISKRAVAGHCRERWSPLGAIVPQLPWLISPCRPCGFILPPHAPIRLAAIQIPLFLGRLVLSPAFRLVAFDLMNVLPLI